MLCDKNHIKKYLEYGSAFDIPYIEDERIAVGMNTYESILESTIMKLDKLNPVYTLSGGIDSSLIFSFLDKPECFCVQVDGNDDYNYAKKLYSDVVKIEFNITDLEKILFEIQSLWEYPHCMLSDMYDYYVYKQFEGRLIIVGEEPIYIEGDRLLDWSKVSRKLFFCFRYFKVDSPYMYNENLYRKDIIRKLSKKRLPEFIYSRPKRKYSGPNPIFINRHNDQIDNLKKQYNIKETDFNKMWRDLNLSIWRKIHD